MRVGAGYPRVISGHYYPGTGVYGEYIVGAAAPGHTVQLTHPLAAMTSVPVQAVAPAQIVSPPWRPMMAPGNPPLGEGHVAIPLTAQTFAGTWGAGGAGAGAQINFTGRPQKPFKTTRLIVRGTKSGPTAIGSLIGQLFVGTDLMQGQLGNLDLETLGAGGAFDTWMSFKQAEPGVEITGQTTLTAFPVAPDFEVYTVNLLGHYLH